MIFDITRHAWDRMEKRDISVDDIEWVIWLGKKTEILGSDLFIFGIEEYRLYKRRDGIDLSHLIGITVKCASIGYRLGQPRKVLTVHRNDYRQAA